MGSLVADPDYTWLWAQRPHCVALERIIRLRTASTCLNCAPSLEPNLLLCWLCLVLSARNQNLVQSQFAGHYLYCTNRRTFVQVCEAWGSPCTPKCTEPLYHSDSAVLMVSICVSLSHCYRHRLLLNRRISFSSYGPLGLLRGRHHLPSPPCLLTHRSSPLAECRKPLCHHDHRNQFGSVVGLCWPWAVPRHPPQ